MVVMLEMFFTHNVTVVRTEKAVDKSTYPYDETQIKLMHDITGLMDRPTTSEKQEYQNMQKTLTRQLYVPHGVDIKSTDEVVFEGVHYSIIGDLEDQGGQHAVWKIPLTRK